MTPLRHILAVIFSCSVCAHASARIGETLEECKTRYGEPVRTVGGLTYFAKSGLSIGVTFYEGKVDRIMFHRADDAPEGAAPLTENEIDLLLKSNSGGQGWESDPSSIRDRVWRTVDHRILAKYVTRDALLMILTSEATDRAEAAKKRATASKLDGF